MTGFSRRDVLRMGTAALCGAAWPAAAGTMAPVAGGGQAPTVFLTLADPSVQPLASAVQRQLCASAPVECLSLDESVWHDLPSLWSVFDRLRGARLVAMVDDRAAVLMGALLSHVAPDHRCRAEWRLDSPIASRLVVRVVDL